MEKDYEKIVKEEIEKFDWRDSLVRAGGRITPTVENIVIYLENSPKFKGKLKYNEFLREDELCGKSISKTELSSIKNCVEKDLGIWNEPKVRAAIDIVVYNHRYNPVVDYIKGLEWDGNKRIERLFIDLLDADDNELTREFTRKWMIAAVKRILIPGCKFDNMIILKGGQGIGKSTICERLAKGFWNSLSLDGVGTKDQIDKLNKTWIGIIDELDGMNTKDITKIKSFLSETYSSERLAYRPTSERFDRHCVFIGSTNRETFLKDSTGNRRFWVIKCNKTTKDGRVYDIMTPEYVDSLWAEAYRYYLDDPDQYLDISEENMEAFEKEMSESNVVNEDSVIEDIRLLLDKEYHINELGEIFNVEDILQDEGRIGVTYRVNKVRASVIDEYVKEKRYDRSRTWIKGGLSDEWEYKKAKFRECGNACWAYVRKNPVKIDKKTYDPMDEFTVGLDL